jgi:hypothetical protein
MVTCSQTATRRQARNFDRYSPAMPQSRKPPRRPLGLLVMPLVATAWRLLRNRYRTVDEINTVRYENEMDRQNTAKQHKSRKSHGYGIHNPKVAGSNPAHATNESK